MQHSSDEYGSVIYITTQMRDINEQFGNIWCDFDRASSLICGNKMPARCNRGFYCRSYFLLNMFQAPLCPSSGAQEYYTVVAACGISCCGFQVAGLVWSWGLCVRFAGCCSISIFRQYLHVSGYLSPSSGGTTVCVQQLVLIILQYYWTGHKAHGGELCGLCSSAVE